MPSEPSGGTGTRRLHPWSLVFLMAGQLRQFGLPVLLALVLGSRSREAGWQLVTLPVLIPYALFVIFHYLTYNYTFGDGELVVRSGLFFLVFDTLLIFGRYSALTSDATLSSRSPRYAGCLSRPSSVISV